MGADQSVVGSRVFVPDQIPDGGARKSVSIDSAMFICVMAFGRAAPEQQTVCAPVQVQSCHVALLWLPVVTCEDARGESFIALGVGCSDLRVGRFQLPPLHSAAPNEHVFTSGEASRGFSKTFFLILGPPSGLLARFKLFRCHH